MLALVRHILPRFDFRVDVAVSEDLGNTRASQEDVHLVAPELALFAVADGMGGHSSGEVAAAMAVEQLQECIRARRAQRAVEAYVAEPTLPNRRRVLGRLKEAVLSANGAVHAASLERPECRGMGSTLDAVWLARHHAFIAHVGDSRTYLARPSAVLQLTQDHVHGEALKADGVVRPKARARGFERLVQAIGLQPSCMVDTLFVDLARGDRLLLCSDGVHGPIGDEAQLGEFLRAGDAQRAATTLVRQACKRGRDNATALVIEVGDCMVRRAEGDRGLSAEDVEKARRSPLLFELPLPAVLAALAAAVELDIDAGRPIPRVVANDLVTYIVLDGVVRLAGDRRVGAGALLFAESLVGVWDAGSPPTAEERSRVLRIRADDFEEVCRGDPNLARRLYRRLATELARRSVSQAGPTMPPAPHTPPPAPDD
jgi:serine/threonine protein phosphatase PrpC